MYRLAIKRNDKKSIELAKKQLLKYPGGMKSLSRSMRNASPLGMLTREERAQFMATLSDKEKDMLLRANRWWGYN